MNVIMQRRWRARLGLLALLASGSPLAIAQTADSDADSALEPVEVEAPVYDIELLIFSYRDAPRGRPEDFVYQDTGREAAQAEREAVLGAGDNPFDLITDAVDAALPEIDDLPRVDPETGELLEPRALEYPLLDAETLRLGEVQRRLVINGGFDTLFHASWRQAVYGPEEETTLALDRIAPLPRTLGGQASIYVTRFLHLKLDLELADLTATGPATDTLVYRINERRKMRSTELHYFDHPHFGALALITPVEADEDAETSELTDG